jgi:hypothetical protein
LTSIKLPQRPRLELASAQYGRQGSFRERDDKPMRSLRRLHGSSTAIGVA